VNKRKIDELIPKAYRVLGDTGIMGKNSDINSKWRGQIASFGASVAQGSLLSAVSFFSAQGSAEVDRSKLMKAISELIGWDKSLYVYVCETEARVAKEKILNAAIALKLAMNLYDLGKGGH
jgi:CRISPR-associated protein Cmr5